MNRQEILERAISKAIEGGWQPLSQSHPMMIQKWEDGHMVEIGVLYGSKDPTTLTWVREVEGIIFDHDFAKGLWSGEHDAWTDEDGGTYSCTHCRGGDVLGSKPRKTLKEPYDSYGISYCREWHLMQMVIADDPIAYLGEHIDG